MSFGRPKQRRLNLTLGSPEVPWRKAICRLETAPEVRHVRKAPAIGDIADGPMLLKRVFQRHSAPDQPSGLDQPSDRGVLLREQRVSISHADAGGLSYLGAASRGIVQNQFDGSAHIHWPRNSADIGELTS